MSFCRRRPLFLCLSLYKLFIGHKRNLAVDNYILLIRQFNYDIRFQEIIFIVSEATPITLEYIAEESNNATNIWWDPISMSTIPYNVEQNSTITVDVVDKNDFNSTMDITIGNITRDGITDNEAESALAFGYWKLQGLFGFIANTSWDVVISEFNDLNFTNQNAIESEGSFLGVTVDIVEFSFEDDFQTTTLVYDKIDGILLHASSEVLGFHLGIGIISINNDTEYFKVDAPFGIYFLIALVIPAIVKIRRK